MSGSPTIYLIRHGEKPPADGKGLSALGVYRAEQLVNVFGSSSTYNIAYILAETPNPDGDEARPKDTVTPLAAALHLDIDTRFQRDDAQGVAGAVLGYAGPGNVLVCWEHKALHEVVKAIGAKHAPHYDGDRFDLLWTMNEPYKTVDESSYTIPPPPASIVSA